MRIATVLLIVGISLVTQSCRIEVSSLTELLSSHAPYSEKNPSAYDFNKSQALKVQTGFKDTLIIGDNPESSHGKAMYGVVSGTRTIYFGDIFANKEEGTGVSKKNIVFLRNFGRGNRNRNLGLKELTSNAYESLRKATRVVHMPRLIPFRAPNDAARMATTNILFVDSAGNMRDSFDGDRNMYAPGHIVWREPFWLDYPISHENVLRVYNTGKVIAATSAKVTREETIRLFEEVVQCGDIKENCFTVIPAQYTSRASAHLAAMSFYLAQFWETPEEIVEVLKECAVDIGEPGVDREYGQGVANLLCPKVLKKELEVVSSYLEVTEKGEVTEGGDLEGVWRAEGNTLQVYLPTALKETTQAEYQGTLNGTVEFNENTVTADFTTEASITAKFLLLRPIEAIARDTVNTEGAYVVEDSLLTLEEETYTYTVTRDSLHLIQSYTLHEALVLLPEPFRSMVDMDSEDVFEDDPIQIRMSFAKVQRLPGDFNEDGRVDVGDFLLFVNIFGFSEEDQRFDVRMDLVPDGIINVADFIEFIKYFGTTSN